MGLSMQKLFWIIALLHLFLPNGNAREPKVYDCFLFFNELKLLEIRLDEMYDQVDHFVLVESIESFQGKEKPLYYLKNKDLFKRYADKIIHIAIPDRLPYATHWEREYYQRNQITKGLADCEDNDLILISDVDEIVRGSDIPKLTRPLINEQAIATSSEQKFFRWYLNRLQSDSPFWIGSIATTFGYLKQHSPQLLRDWREIFPKIEDSGWHFSNMGGLAIYREKLENFSHPEVNTPENRDPQTIYNYISSYLQRIPLNDSFPAYIKKHQKDLTESNMLESEEQNNYL